MIDASRNFEIRRVGTTWHCEILVTKEPFIREGIGTSLADAVGKAIERKDAFYA